MKNIVYKTKLILSILVIAASFVFLQMDQSVVLAAGSCGSYDVTTIQLVLGISPDGICGPQTIQAIKDFQTAHNLTADGIVGPQTAAAMGLGGGAGGNSAVCDATHKCPTGQSCVSGSCINDSSSGGGGSTGGGNGSADCGGDNRLELKNGICMPKNTYNKNSIAGSSTLLDVIFTIINYMLILSGLIAVGALVIGGFWYITAAGNEEQSEKGKKAIISAIIGLVVVILAYAIVNVITSTLTTTDVLKKSA